MDAKQALRSFCPLFEYPQEAFIEDAAACEAAVRSLDGTAAALLQVFMEELGSMTLPEREELFIKTFDMNVRCTLDLGWQLFGEDYNRGLFLAKVRTLLSRYGIAETQELPDHVSQVLRLLACMNAEEGTAFAESCVVPALQKSHAALEEENPYQRLLKAALMLLTHVYAIEMEELTDGAHIQHV
jgi:nitrate reductase molybdenum cofactor assembly chaperone